jgi:hypothetical protein
MNMWLKPLAGAVSLLTVGLAKPSPWEKRNGNIFGADGAFGAELVILDHLLNCCLFYHPGFVHNLSAKN